MGKYTATPEDSNGRLLCLRPMSHADAKDPIRLWAQVSANYLQLRWPRPLAFGIQMTLNWNPVMSARPISEDSGVGTQDSTIYQNKSLKQDTLTI